MNKTLLVAAIALLIYSAGHSQTFISGDLGFSHANSKNSDRTYKESNIVISPMIGGFVSERLAVGTDFSLAFSNTEQEVDRKGYNNYYRHEEVKAKQHYIGIFARLYSPVSEKVRFVFHLSNGLVNGDVSYKEEYESYEYDYYFNEDQYTSYNSSSKSEISGYRAYFKPGLSVNVSKHWDVELFISNLSYHHLKYSNEKSPTPQEEQNDIDFSFNDISFGVTFKF